MTKQQQAIALLILFCIASLFLRVKLTKSFFFGFLLWNLFLAIIPYLISEWMKNKKTTKIKTFIGIFIWLLFLPNAPYIITDFIHLHHLKSTLVWYDLYMLFSFAFTGLLLAIMSMDTIYDIILHQYSKKVANIIMVFFTLLTGFGIYLGRFLRLNSWYVFTNPKYVYFKITHALSQPNAWYTSLGFGFFLTLILLIFKTLKSSTK